MCVRRRALKGSHTGITIFLYIILYLYIIFQPAKFERIFHAPFLGLKKNQNHLVEILVLSEFLPVFVERLKYGFFFGCLQFSPDVENETKIYLRLHNTYVLCLLINLKIKINETEGYAFF